ncbi:flagellar export protein FliJ [Aquisalibacillus elongatus]|uniref:Flagellar FliJ protein n=1 Tax=Aquisalibacillus elongatus TaxID=485577 RepID=A0A3N5BE48_9BACI|nr:flagellar export protein FliJ [Aquisalibacillus elongatus]RPF55994.1 flagellar FliJ protein [Aquisalibacillus elongatus]
MSHIQSLEKLLEIRESDFNRAHGQYNRAADYFSEVGQQLYDLLVQKEKIEEKLRLPEKHRVKASDLTYYNQQLQALKSKEESLQMTVHQARLNLQEKEKSLTEAHQEFKKLEKIISKKQHEYYKAVQKKEAQMLDEVSVQQFLRSNG